MIISEIANGVEGCYIKSNKFKTSSISVNMFIPANEKAVSAYSLLYLILTDSTKDYPDYTSLNKALKNLYNASLFGGIQKFGDMRLVKFGISVLDDNFTLFGETISSKAADLLLGVIFNPLIENGKFNNRVFENNKRILIDQINAQINEKRGYAISNTEKAMFEGEPASIQNYGTVKTVESLTNEDIVAAHKYLLQNAFVRINVISQNKSEKVFDRFKEYFLPLSRNVEKKNFTCFHKTKGEVKHLEEKMNVTQGKLCLGFSLDIGETRQDAANAAVFVDVFGGGPYSKLFTNVREKQSLCYYCAARLNSKKGTFIVDSGILEENKQKAYDGILEQLEQIKSGNITEDEVNSSKIAIADTLGAYNDQTATLDSWYVLSTFNDGETIEDYTKLIKNVSVSDVIKIANSVKLDTVYFLGKAKEENND